MKQAIEPLVRPALVISGVAATAAAANQFGLLSALSLDELGNTLAATLQGPLLTLSVVLSLTAFVAAQPSPAKTAGSGEGVAEGEPAVGQAGAAAPPMPPAGKPSAEAGLYDRVEEVLPLDIPSASPAACRSDAESDGAES